MVNPAVGNSTLLEKLFPLGSVNGFKLCIGNCFLAPSIGRNTGEAKAVIVSSMEGRAIGARGQHVWAGLHARFHVLNKKPVLITEGCVAAALRVLEGLFWKAIPRR